MKMDGQHITRRDASLVYLVVACEGWTQQLSRLIYPPYSTLAYRVPGKLGNDSMRRASRQGGFPRARDS